MPQKLTKQLYKIRTDAAKAGVKAHGKTATITIGKTFIIIRDSTGVGYTARRPPQWAAQGDYWGGAIFNLKALYSLLSTIENVGADVEVRCGPRVVMVRSARPVITMSLNRLEKINYETIQPGRPRED